eukprot:6189339-Pleurochrysis_carterae.AAC.1
MKRRRRNVPSRCSARLELEHDSLFDRRSRKTNDRTTAKRAIAQSTTSSGAGDCTHRKQRKRAADLFGQDRPCGSKQAHACLAAHSNRRTLSPIPSRDACGVCCDPGIALASGCVEGRQHRARVFKCFRSDSDGYREGPNRQLQARLREASRQEAHPTHRLR